jgi:hypothetical protein
MESDSKIRGASDSDFSFGVNELRRAKAAQKLALHPDPELHLDPKKSSHNEQGGDPYNTSGSFDRTKNWTRVGKR